MTDSYGIGLPMTTEYGELNIFDFSGTEGMEKELELSGDISSSSKINCNKKLVFVISVTVVILVASIVLSTFHYSSFALLLVITV